MSELDHKEGWVPKNWCFRIVILGKTLDSPLDSKEIKPVNPKGNQCWIFIGRTDTEAEAPILRPPDGKGQLIGKDSDAGKDWGKRRREWQRMRWLETITDSVDMNLSKLQETVKDREAWCIAFHGVTKSPTWLSDWTTTTVIHSGHHTSLLDYLSHPAFPVPALLSSTPSPSHALPKGEWSFPNGKTIN